MRATVSVPIVLIDAPDDDACEEAGWVETTVSESEARDLLAPLCCDAEGERPHRPNFGAATRVWLRPRVRTDVGGGEPAEDWADAVEGEPNAREFWKIPTV